MKVTTKEKKKRKKIMNTISTTKARHWTYFKRLTALTWASILPRKKKTKTKKETSKHYHKFIIASSNENETSIDSLKCLLSEANFVFSVSQ